MPGAARGQHLGPAQALHTQADGAAGAAYRRFGDHGAGGEGTHRDPHHPAGGQLRAGLIGLPGAAKDQDRRAVGVGQVDVGEPFRTGDRHARAEAVEACPPQRCLGRLVGAQHPRPQARAAAGHGPVPGEQLGQVVGEGFGPIPRAAGPIARQRRLQVLDREQRPAQAGRLQLPAHGRDLGGDARPDVHGAVEQNAPGQLDRTVHTGS